jgi:competence protein ComEC
MQSHAQVFRYTILTLGIVVVAGMVSLWSIEYTQSNSDELTVTFFDVGQGDAIFIETPNKNQVLIDGGMGRAVLRHLGSHMSFFDRSIDVVIATHPDADHIGGLPNVLARYDVGMFLTSAVHDSGTDARALTASVLNEPLEIIHANHTMTLLLDRDVVLEVLFPDRDVEMLETNTASLILKLTYKDTSFLFTGDAPQGIETYVASIYEDALQSDVLKVGHHGSKTSSAEVFLGYVNPEYAIISAGCDNAYGHPHREVVERLQRFEIEILETCAHGNITFVSDGHELFKT